MQCLQREILVQRRDIVLQILWRRNANYGAQIDEVSTLWIDGVFANTPRIHVLTRLQSINRQKRFALVFECRRDWSLVETIERQQVLRRGCRAGAFVEFLKRAIRSECFGMSLLLVKPLKDLPDFDQLRDSLALTVGQL